MTVVRATAKNGVETTFSPQSSHIQPAVLNENIGAGQNCLLGGSEGETTAASWFSRSVIASVQDPMFAASIDSFLITQNRPPTVQLLTILSQTSH
jgi:hypothetical protein